MYKLKLKNNICTNLKKTPTICYRAKAMIHSDQINMINITSNTEWNRTT